MALLIGEQIRQVLQDIASQQLDRFLGLIPPEELARFRSSAVIMPLIWNDNEWHLLFTHRSARLIEHSGQVSFPGGAREQGDGSLEMTALREMWEEIGIRPEDVDVFGTLGEMPVITGYRVQVFVGQIPWPYELTINHDEVESVFTVPLSWLADPDHRMIRYRSYAGHEVPVIFFDLYEGYQLWGASAEMTVTLLEVLK
jgi:8-oxo-dGTP pyrophosphatase MutT (NUDIX family)